MPRRTIFSAIAIVLLSLLALPLRAQSSHSVSGSFIASVTPGVTGYNVYRRTGTVPAAIIQSITGTGWVDTTVAGGTTYFYSVTAVAPGAESPMSNEVTAAIPPDTAPPTGPTYSLFTTQIPVLQSLTDGASVEVGVKFQSSVAGSIIGIRFYKVPQSTGTHTGTLWLASTKAKIPGGSGTFTNETASGWQTLTFAAPIPLPANTQIVASYHTAFYADTHPFFTTTFTSNMLSAPVGAGVYTYGSTSVFPSSSWDNSNYFADVIFQPATIPVSVTVAPAAISVFPNNTQQFTATVTGATNTAVTWTATGGAISPTGLFTAGTGTGNFAATATSVADPTKSGVATVKINPPPPVITLTCAGLTTQNIPSGTSIALSASGGGATATTPCPVP